MTYLTLEEEKVLHKAMSNGVALISTTHPVGKSPLSEDINPSTLVTVELSEEQVKKIKEGVAGGLRMTLKRGRGRPKIAGPRPWETEGISRQAWYKKRKKAKDHLGIKVLPSPAKSDTTVEMWSEAFEKVKSW